MEPLPERLVPLRRSSRRSTRSPSTNESNPQSSAVHNASSHLLPLRRRTKFKLSVEVSVTVSHPVNPAATPTAGPSSDVNTKPSIDALANHTGGSLVTSPISTVKRTRKAPSGPRAKRVEVEPGVGVKLEPVDQDVPTKPSVELNGPVGAPGPSSQPDLGRDLPPSPQKGKSSTCNQPEHRRPERFREKCPKNIVDRFRRVMTQRMFMIDRENIPGVKDEQVFKVLGSTGNIYTVNIGPRPCCDCPDSRKGNVPCKHIIFVFLKVLKVPQTASTWYQRGLLPHELQEVFRAAPDAQAEPSAEQVKVRNAYLRATGVITEPKVDEPKSGDSGPGSKRLSAVGEDCPVCFEEMSQEDEQGGLLLYDEALAGCGKPIHKECFRMWAATAVKTNGKVTCVWCRTTWPDDRAVAGGKGKGKAGVEYTALGYMNMADIAGLSRERDTSSYYWGPMRGRRMWESRYGDE